MIKATPPGLSIDNVADDLFPALHYILKQQTAYKEDLLDVVSAIHTRFCHSSMKFQLIDLPEKSESFKNAIDTIVEIQKEMNDKIESNSPENVNKEFNKIFPEHTEFKWVISNENKRSLSGLHKLDIGRQSKDTALDAMDRSKFIKFFLVQVIAWSASDFDLSHRLKMIDSVLANKESRKLFETNAFKYLAWIEQLHNKEEWQRLETDTSDLLNSWSDCLGLMKNGTHYELEKLSRYQHTWPEPVLTSSYLSSGSNVTRLYFCWSLSILRNALMYIGMSKSDAQLKIEKLYRNLGIEIGWTQIMRNSGGVDRASLPDPARYYFEFGSLLSFFKALKLL